ncbi:MULTISPECIES: CoA pyrophosphatase [unclassified Clostridium]|uniref:NUDIX hydrolase n=1 Tax=unclassified Clostridium TaxID=2614128 RepID=UPI0018977EE7|nr:MULTISPECIES: CoA pyrophosphatase [unclassified Clostridium]MCR1952654.1 CoA pyrophosphatase [Clostridium sp. DSM 100503]
MLNDVIKKFHNNIPYINGWEKMKRASVAILFVEIEDKLNIVFEVRAKHMRSQPGDISLPGGKIDLKENEKEAVIREVCEELGLSNEDFEIIAPLNILVTHYSLLIHPFVGYIKNFDHVNINKDEVDHIFLVPLDYLLNNEPRIKNSKIIVNRCDDFPYDLINGGKNYKFKEGIYRSLFYEYQNYVIWGITALILEDFLNDFNKYIIKG